MSYTMQACNRLVAVLLTSVKLQCKCNRTDKSIIFRTKLVNYWIGRLNLGMLYFFSLQILL
jgi:hypothetical protein